MSTIVNSLLRVIGSLAFAWVIADVWQRAFVPIGLPNVTVEIVFCALTILALINLSLCSDYQLEKNGEQLKELGELRQFYYTMGRAITLAISYGIMRLVLAYGGAQ